MYGYDGLPMLPVASPSPDYVHGPEEPQTPPAPQDEDEHEPMFIQPHDHDFVPEPIYPEYIPLEDEHVLPAEEQPLPTVFSPTTKSPEYVAESNPEEDLEEYEDDETEDGPVDYPMDGGDAGDDETSDEDKDEEECYLRNCLCWIYPRGGMCRGGGSGDAAGAVHLARRSSTEGGDSEANGDGDGVGMVRMLATRPAFRPSLVSCLLSLRESLPSMPDAYAVSGVSRAKTHVYIPAPGESEAQNELPDSILSNEPKPLVQHRPPPS
uniref:Uncharacterized protein n=1 Tax=Tanacetum cinerariifolium TaxID=118510 RepID=A0A6L2KYM0_TANCI|nr:hypothetical protein [Tanacetum cinerariifolium]